MKKILFASVIAFVAIFATSCKDKNAGDAPKARFEYSVEDLTVTFTNQSVDAETYAWDFGDGSAISAEENPIHEYAAEGTYKVTLTAKNQFGEKAASLSVVVEKPLFNLKIDGDLSDWDNLPAEWLATAEKGDLAYYDHLYKIKFISDKKKVYFYVEFDGEEGAVQNIDILIDTDNDAETGHTLYLWEPSGADYLIEGSPYQVIDEENPEWSTEDYGDAGLYLFVDGGDRTKWTWEWQDVTAIEACKVVDLGNNVAAIEGSILRSAFANMKSFKVGVFTSLNWAENGSLPELAVDIETGDNVASPMLEVILN